MLVAVESRLTKTGLMDIFISPDNYEQAKVTYLSAITKIGAPSG